MNPNPDDPNAPHLDHEEGCAFMGAVFEVYNDLGSGFLEEIYHKSLELELNTRGIPFVSAPTLSIFDQGRSFNKRYYADLILADGILVELKAVRALAPEHEAQLVNHLKGTRKGVGYLINFGSFPHLEWKRFVV